MGSSSSKAAPATEPKRLSLGGGALAQGEATTTVCTNNVRKRMCKSALRYFTGFSAQDCQDEMMKVFLKWDHDRNGVISKEELAAVMNELADGQFSDEDVNRIMCAADADNNGSIDIEEMVHWLTSSPSLPTLLRKTEKMIRDSNSEMIDNLHILMLELQAATAALEEQFDGDEVQMNVAFREKFGCTPSKYFDTRFDKEAHIAASLAQRREKLTPLAQDVFRFHDQKKDGVLEGSESITFFANFVHQGEKHLFNIMKESMYLDLDLQKLFTGVDVTAGDTKGKQKLIKEHISKVAQDMLDDCLWNFDRRMVAAFKVIDVNRDSMLQESEVIEALLVGSARNIEVMHALGLSVEKAKKDGRLDVNLGL